MPPTSQVDPRAVLQRVARDAGDYPIAAFEFVQQGLAFTVARMHGPVQPGKSMHVSGRQLCEGLRDIAQRQWGLLARTVLRKWNITSTMDFGRIVFSMVEHEVMKTTERDTIEDFRNVYDFRTAFETDYRIPANPGKA